MSDELTPAAIDRGARRWLVPAVAVLAMVAATAAVVLLPLLQDDDDLGDARVRHTGGYGEDARPRLATLGLDDGAVRTCDREMGDVLPGADAQATLLHASGDLVTIYATPDEYTLCVVGDEEVTVHHPVAFVAADDPVADPDVLDWSTLALRPRYDAVRHVAGGPVPDDVSTWGVEYRFPDGHAEPANVFAAADGRRWWVMDYHATVGVLVDENASSADLAPVEVTIATDDDAVTATRAWLESMCAQANHGC